jgi:hypothetical protein
MTDVLPFPKKTSAPFPRCEEAPEPSYVSQLVGCGYPPEAAKRIYLEKQAQILRSLKLDTIDNTSAECWRDLLIDALAELGREMEVPKP